jgi:hypothetical protein
MNCSPEDLVREHMRVRLEGARLARLSREVARSARLNRRQERSRRSRPVRSRVRS